MSKPAPPHHKANDEIRIYAHSTDDGSGLVGYETIVEGAWEDVNRGGFQFSSTDRALVLAALEVLEPMADVFVQIPVKVISERPLAAVGRDLRRRLNVVESSLDVSFEVLDDQERWQKADLRASGAAKMGVRRLDGGGSVEG